MIYALRITNENEQIHILDAISGKVYICIHCGDKLIPNQGKIKSWHFKHKTNPACAIGERSGIGCIINTEYNPGYCRGSIDCEKECTLNRSFGAYILNLIKESFYCGVSSIHDFINARLRGSQ